MSDKKEYEEVQIDIEGRFIIQKIYKVELKKNISIDNFEEIIIEKLPTFEDGTPSKPGLGFKLKKLIEPTDTISRDDKLLKIYENLIVIEFKKEKYRKVPIRGKNAKLKYKIQFNNYIYNHIFFIFPSFILFKGPKENLELVESTFLNLIRDEVKIIDTIKFDPDFLLWILINFRNGNYLIDQDFYIDFFTDLSTTGQFDDYWGKEISSKESKDVTQSIPMLLTILSGRNLKSCKFAFTIDGFAGTVEIKNYKVLSILHSLGVFKLIPNLEKIIISLNFVLRSIKLQNKWDSLENEKKYPSEADFLNIIKECKKVGYRIYNIEEIMNKYKMKKGE